MHFDRKTKKKKKKREGKKLLVIRKKRYKKNILSVFNVSRGEKKSWQSFSLSTQKRLMELIVFDGCAKKQARKTKSKNDRHQAHESIISNFSNRHPSLALSMAWFCYFYTLFALLTPSSEFLSFFLAIYAKESRDVLRMRKSDRDKNMMRRKIPGMTVRQSRARESNFQPLSFLRIER